MEIETVNLWPETAIPAELKLDFKALDGVFTHYQQQLMSHRKEAENVMNLAGEEEFEVYGPSKLLKMRDAFQSILAQYAGEHPLLCFLIQMMLSIQQILPVLIEFSVNKHFSRQN
jgi:hypothetical protein